MNFEPLFNGRKPKVYNHSNERFEAIEAQQAKIIEMIQVLSMRFYGMETKGLDE